MENMAEDELVLDIEGQMSQEEGDGENPYQSTVSGLIREAVDYYEENLEPDQVEATDRYQGRPYGDEDPARSKVVSTDTRDVTRSQMPSLMRIFFNREHVVEFRPRIGGFNSIEEYEQQAAVARHMTAHVDRIVTEMNPGFLIFHGTIKDSLVRRLGYIKWMWENKETVTSEAYDNLSQEDLIELTMDEEIDFRITATIDGGEGAPDTYNAVVTRTVDEGYERIMSVPPEEVVWSSDARSRDEAECFAHIRSVPMDDLLDMGISKELIEEKMGDEGKRTSVGSESLSFARLMHNRDEGEVPRSDSEDEARRSVVFVEAYIRVGIDPDEEGAQKTELRMFQCIGRDYEIINGEGDPVDEIPFAVFTPDPEPHTIIGLSNHDLVKQTEKIKTQIERAQLDSLAQAVDSDMEVVQGEVNMRDLLKKETSKLIRVRKPGMLRELTHRFVGDSTLPVLAYYDAKREDNTGMSKAGRGLDADALQSSTKAAVAGTFDKAQESIDLLAMVFAETGMRDLYVGLLRLAIKHRKDPVVLMINGQPVESDPREWDAGANLVVNLALGQGTPQDRIQLQAGILTQQEGYLQQGVPFVNYTHIRNSLDDIARLGNLPSERYFGSWGPEQQAQMEQQQAEQAKNAPKDPNTMIAEAEVMKAQSAAMEGQAKLALAKEKMYLEDERERHKEAHNNALRKLEIEAQNQVQIHSAQLQQAVAGDKAMQRAELEAAKAQRAHELAQQQAQEQAQQAQQQQAQQQQAQQQQAQQAPPTEGQGV